MAARQLTFENDRARARGPRVSTAHERAAESRRVTCVLEEMEAPETTLGPTAPRLEALNAVEDELHEFIRRRGVGGEFQCNEFTDHLHDIGRTPDPDVLDERAVGVLVRRFARCGLIRRGEYRLNHGSRHTRYNGTARPVWEILSVEHPNDVVQRRLERGNGLSRPADGEAIPCT